MGLQQMEEASLLELLLSASCDDQHHAQVCCGKEGRGESGEDEHCCMMMLGIGHTQHHLCPTAPPLPRKSLNSHVDP